MENYEKGSLNDEIPKENIVPVEESTTIKPDINIINGALETLEKEEKEGEKKPPTIH